MKVQNKVIVVTGGGSGMGRELVLSLLSKGSKVIAADINESALQGTVDMAIGLKNSLHTFVTDITSKASVEELFAKSASIYGGVDGIINNAGIIQPFLKVSDTGFDTMERVFDVNFYGTLYMTKTFLPHLLTRPEAHITNISSMGGFMPVPGQIIYGASKAAVKMLTEGLSTELSDTFVRTTTVYPGAIRTDIKVNSGLGVEAGDGPNEKNMNKALSPVIAAEMIIQAMEKDKKRLYIGKDSKLMNFLYKNKPDLAVKLIYQKVKDKI